MKRSGGSPTASMTPNTCGCVRSSPAWPARLSETPMKVMAISPFPYNPDAVILVLSELSASTDTNRSGHEGVFVNIDVDVVVVGGGPVGTTALALCGRAGLTAIGFEKDAEMWPTARAVHFDGETMRTLQSLGIASRFQDVVIPMKDVEIVNE